MNKDIFAIGDIHGEWSALKNKIDYLGLSDCVIICVGDYGIGFKRKVGDEMYKQRKLNEFFTNRNIKFLTIRGNHDNPRWFSGSTKPHFSNIEFVEDYSLKTINDQKILFVGGAISVDRHLRCENIDYWKDEYLVLDESKIQQCDVLITHSAPTWNGPFDKIGYFQRDEKLWEECIQERKNTDILIEKSGAKRHYCGHFHGYWAVDFKGCYSRILDILDIVNINNIN